MDKQDGVRVLVLRSLVVFFFPQPLVIEWLRKTSARALKQPLQTAGSIRFIAQERVCPGNSARRVKEHNDVQNLCRFSPKGRQYRTSKAAGIRHADPHYGLDSMPASSQICLPGGLVSARLDFENLELRKNQSLQTLGRRN